MANCYSNLKGLKHTCNPDKPLILHTQSIFQFHTPHAPHILCTHLFTHHPHTFLALISRKIPLSFQDHPGYPEHIPQGSRSDAAFFTPLSSRQMHLTSSVIPTQDHSQDHGSQDTDLHGPHPTSRRDSVLTCRSWGSKDLRTPCPWGKSWASAAHPTIAPPSWAPSIRQNH